MLFNKLPARSATAELSTRRRVERARPTRGPSIAIARTRIARAFYCDVLQGQQVWEADRASGAGVVSFIVAGTRIDVSTRSAVECAPVILPVPDPQALAERCWDAGYSVRVGHEAMGPATVSVIDPFGRRIVLV